MCGSRLSADGDQQELDRIGVLDVASSFSQKALRTIAFAFKEVGPDHEDLRHDDLSGLVLAGLQGMIDPPKDSARQAIAISKEAGIRVIMITGDHPETAQAIASDLGIQAHRVVIGEELSEMDEAQMQDVVKEVSVFARVSPEHKRQLAAALKANGEIVAMTGDGINDAPALKEAHVGVAMGIQGTDVARQAADLILLNDDFATIPKAIEVGRDAFEKISRKAFIYTIPTNFAQVLLVIGAVFMGIFVPFFGADYVLAPIMILWINLLDAVLWTIPLIYEQMKQGLLKRLPRDASASIFDRFFLARTILMGTAIAIPPFFIYWYYGSAAVVDGVVVDPILLVQAQTAAFWSVIISHLGYVVSARDVEKSVFSFEPWIIPFGNKVLLGGIAISVLIRLLPTFVPEAAVIFKTEEFPLEWWPLILVSFLPSFIAIEMDKWIRARARLSEIQVAKDVA
jgi:magnesium-transporting ATPase (P-type)